MPHSNPFSFDSKPAKRPYHGVNLDWEEAAVDELSEVEGFAGEVRPTRTVWWLRIFILALGAILLGRLFTLQIMQGRSFRALAENNRLRAQPIVAARGLVKDRNGAPLVENIASFQLIATPLDLPQPALDAEISALSQLLHLDEQDVRNKLANVDYQSFQPVVVSENLSQQNSILFETRAAQFVGFSVSPVPIRQYLSPEAFSHVIGYTGIISPEELAQKTAQTDSYTPRDSIGKSGIEQYYEQYLKGLDGQNEIEVDAANQPIKVLGQLDPITGDTVELNLDRQLQEQLYQNFQSAGSRVKGAAVALNPKTGEVLALLSVPGFDNNQFAKGISSVQYQQLLSDKSLPLFDRVISGTYPPGSTVKPMVGLGALENGVVQSDTVIVDNGVLTIPNQFGGAAANFYGWKHSGLGPMTMTSAIAHSSDIYFYTVSGGNPLTGTPGLGVERLAATYRDFHLGQTTGIDLQGEKPGLVPDPAWKAARFPGDAVAGKWYLGDTYHMGIGQGDVLVTPLQVAEWTAIIANGGVGYQPQILKRVVDDQGRVVLQSKPKILVKKFASDANIKVIQQGMRETVVSGTGNQLQSLPISAAGKTGTSQFDGADPNRTHAWFTAYAPYENPQIVITVLVEAGGGGYEVAEPIVAKTLKWWANNRYGK